MKTEPTPRQLAVSEVLRMLRSPISLMTKSERERAEQLAVEYAITAFDLLALATKRASNT